MIPQYFKEIQEHGDIISTTGDTTHKVWVRAATKPGPDPSQPRAALNYLADRSINHTLDGFLQHIHHPADTPNKVPRLIYEAAINATSAFHHVVELNGYPRNPLEAAVAVRINPGMNYPEFPMAGTEKQTATTRMIDRLFEKRRYGEYGDEHDMRVKKKILGLLIEHGGDPKYQLPTELARTIHKRNGSHPRSVADHMRKHGLAVVKMQAGPDRSPLLARSFSPSSSDSRSGSDMNHSPALHSGNSSSSPQRVMHAASGQGGTRPRTLPHGTHRPAPSTSRNVMLNSAGAPIQAAKVPAASRSFFNQTPDIPSITDALGLQSRRTPAVFHPSAPLPVLQSHSVFPPPAPGFAYNDKPFPVTFDRSSVIQCLNRITAEFPST